MTIELHCYCSAFNPLSLIGLDFRHLMKLNMS
jgi:hypothetical protein